MASQPPSIRQQIIDNVVWTVAQIDDMEGCFYGEPFDHAQPRLPWAWVWDFEQIYDADQTVGQFFNTLTIGIAIAFRFAGRDDNTLLRQGNALLARLEAGIMSDIGRGINKDTQGKLAFNTTPRTSEIQEVPEAERIGAVTMLVDVQYYVDRKNPYSQTVSI